MKVALPTSRSMQTRMVACAAAAAIAGTAAVSRAGEATASATATLPTAAGDDAAPAGTRQPVPYVERSIALPAMTLAPAGRFNVFTVRPGAGRSEDPWFFLGAGARFGIIDELEVELTPFQSVLGPDFHYGGSAGITGDFLDGPVEVGARLRVFWHEDGAVFTPGLPLRFHLDDFVRIDTGVAVSIAHDGQAGFFDFSTVPANVEPGIPARVAFQIIDPLWAGLSTGVGIIDVAEADDTTFVPLGFNLGGTVPGDEGPLLDIEAGFSFPQLFLTGAPDAVVPDVWNVGLQLQGYLYL